MVTGYILILSCITACTFLVLLYAFHRTFYVLFEGIVDPSRLRAVLVLLWSMTGLCAVLFGVGFVQECGNYASYGCVKLPESVDGWVALIQRTSLAAVLAQSALLGLMGYTALLLQAFDYRHSKYRTVTTTASE